MKKFFVECSYSEAWRLCVSTASSFLSTSWEEHFFLDEGEARAFARQARKNGFAVLVVTPDEY